MRKGYKDNLRAEAISMRLADRPWIEIQDCIQRKHQVKPSIRRMQVWFAKFKEGKEDPTGEKAAAHKFADSIQNAITLAEGASGIKAIEFSSWIASQNKGEQKLDLTTSIVSNFHLLESHVGRRNFDKALEYYQKHRDEMFKNKRGSSGPTGITGSTGPTGR